MVNATSLNQSPVPNDATARSSVSAELSSLTSSLASMSIRNSTRQGANNG